MTDVVEIIRDLAPEIIEVYENPQPTIVEVVAAGPSGPQGIQGIQGPEGPQGPQGPSGSNDIGGYGVSILNAINGDVLGFNGAAWYNRRQETLSDGGNF